MAVSDKQSVCQLSATIGRPWGHPWTAQADPWRAPRLCPARRSLWSASPMN